MTLIERHGHNENGSEVVTICGEKTLIHDYDWYMERAIRNLTAVACNKAGEVKFKSVDYRFVRRFRDAIRENYNHGHNLPDEEFRMLTEIKIFIATIERIEARQMQGLG